MTNPAKMNAGQLKLKRARKEIEAVLAKYDIAGYVNLHAPDANELFWNIWPSYSILKGDIPGTIHIKSKLSDYGGNVDKQKRDQALTAQMAHVFAETLPGHAIAFMELSTMLDAKLNAEHTEPVAFPDEGSTKSGLH